MIVKDIGIGKIVVTDADFRNVSAGDETFLERINEHGFGVPRVASMVQVHGDHIEYVDAPGHHVSEATDGLCTDQVGQMIYTKTADCVPIILWSEKNRFVAALHCGWKGFLAGIIDTFADLLREHEYAGENFQAFLGPHLRVSSFEVKQDFIDALPEEHHGLLVEKGGKVHFDLTAGVVKALHGHGILDVEDCGIDTFTDPAYFSYRVWNQEDPESRAESYSTFANCVIMT